MDEIVWLRDLRCWAIVLSRGAYISLVQYEEGDEQIQEWVDNDDYDEWSERAIEFEPDE